MTRLLAVSIVSFLFLTLTDSTFALADDAEAKVAPHSASDKKSNLVVADVTISPRGQNRAVIDLGEVEKPRKFPIRLRVKNGWNGPIKLVDSKSSCGCVVPSGLNHAIKTGETVAMPVAFESPVRTGKFAQGFQSVFRDGGGDEVKLTVTIIGRYDGPLKTENARLALQPNRETNKQRLSIPIAAGFEQDKVKDVTLSCNHVQLDSWKIEQGFLVLNVKQKPTASPLVESMAVLRLLGNDRSVITEYQVPVSCPTCLRVVPEAANCYALSTKDVEIDIMVLLAGAVDSDEVTALMKKLRVELNVQNQALRMSAELVRARGRLIKLRVHGKDGVDQKIDAARGELLVHLGGYGVANCTVSFFDPN